MTPRTLVALAFLAGLTALGACRDDGGAAVTQAAAAADPGDPADRRVARDVFGALASPSSGAAAPYGGFSQGCAAGNVALPETGATWQAMRLSRNRNWGQPILVDYLQQLSAFAATQPGWAGLYIGDMSQPRGGPMLTGHASHQSGLDADIWMLPPSRLDLNRTERENLSSIRTDRSSGAYVNSDWTPQHMEILRRAASDPRVARIFIFPGAKVWMCEHATGDRSWLRNIRPWYGHNYHFHVRLSCPAGATGCVDQAPPPPGDGCAEAQEWVNNILNPPPPDPNATPTPPRGPLLMAELPGACARIAAQ